MSDDSQNNQNESQQVNIELSEEMAQGTYSNLAVITHSKTEFVLDFIRIVPGTSKANVKSRIILTPEHAKRLKNALDDNINRYENANGKIDDIQQSEGGDDGMPMNFGGPTAQA